MTGIDKYQAKNVKTVAESILAEALGGQVWLDPGSQLRGGDRSKVVRFSVLDAPVGAPTSVISKQALVSGDGAESYDPDAAAFGPAWRLFNEWAGLQFLTEIGDAAALVPRFYGGNRQAGVILLEDLGTGIGLHDLLLGTDPIGAETALVSFAAALGRLHARTVGKQPHYSSIRNRLGPPIPAFSVAAESALTPEQVAALLPKTLAALQITPAPRLEAELGEVAAAWAAPGRFLAYIHGDPCPDNCLVIDSTVRLMDFEFGGYHHALLDGVYGRMHFPSCWCVNRLPSHMPLRMEAAYRAELVQGCPEAAEDTLFYCAVVDACAYWTIGMLHWAIPGVLTADEVWGTATFRQRVLLRLDVLADATAEFGYLEAIGATIQAVATKLRAVWSVEVTEMPYYPAFR